jgi:hypothetical protein
VRSNRCAAGRDPGPRSLDLDTPPAERHLARLVLVANRDAPGQAADVLTRHERAPVHRRDQQGYRLIEARP